MNSLKDKYTHYKRFTPKGIVDDRAITSSTRLILREADRIGIEVKQLVGTNTFELKYKDKIRNFHYQNMGSNTSTGLFIANSKRNTRNRLQQSGIGVANGYGIKLSDSDMYKKEVFDSLKKPLIVKPNMGTQGKAISVGIETLFEYITAIRKAFNYSKRKDPWVIVEEQLEGFNEYRVLVTREKVIGVIKRIPANVVGDGVSNIRKLIKQKNSDVRRGDYDDHPPLFKILMDDEMKEYLQRQGYTWKHIPAKDEKIFLRGVSNISLGGDSIDLTDETHDSVKQICLKAINSIPGLELGGVDFMTEDITVEQKEGSYAILEINDSPGLDIHDFPYEGENRHAGVAFLRVLFDEDFE